MNRVWGALAKPAVLTRVALGMIAVQLVFRAWVVYGNWFYFDDFIFLSKAYQLPLSWRGLFEPYAGHLMPAGLVVTWLITRAAPLNWPLAATLILLAQAAASYGCWRMFRVLFGHRRLNLVWLGIYLFSPVTLGAYLWWAAAINQLPFQIALFYGITAHVTYLRTRRIQHAFVAAWWQLFGVLFYEKAALLVLVYAFLALGYFATGSLWRRIRHVVASYWRGVLLYVGIAAAHLVGYVAANAYLVPVSPLPEPQRPRAPVFDVAVNMIAKALLPGLAGGPWRWEPVPPDARADPPTWAWTATLVLALALVAVALTRRVRAGRAVVFWLAYMATTILLVSTARAVAVGPAIGLVYRYSTDAVPLTVLTLALAFMTLPGAMESSEPRPAAATARPGYSRAAVGGVALVVFLAGCAVSAVDYVNRWHTSNAARSFIGHARSEVDRLGTDVAIGDTEVPDTLIWKVSSPWNLTSNFLAPTGIKLNRRVTDELYVFDEQGYLRPGRVAPHLHGTRTGEGCDIRGRVRIRLVGALFDPRTWWLRIGYIAASDTPVVIRAGDVAVQTRLTKGLHAVFIPGHGQPDAVELSGLADGALLCIGDDIQLGPATLLPR